MADIGMTKGSALGYLIMWLAGACFAAIPIYLLVRFIRWAWDTPLPF